MNILEHTTRREVLRRFLGVLGIVVLYFLFISYHYGAEKGIVLTLLTWSMFVFCTPIADAGILVDFPVRLLTRLRMIYSEMIVWCIATLLNLYTFFTHPEFYQKTFLLTVFYKILSTPFPFWAIILLSAVGTYLSVYFGDELMDVTAHNEREKYHKHGLKHKFIIVLFLIISTLLLYLALLHSLNISIPL